MIDDKKIEEAAFDLYKNSKLDFVSSESVEGFKEGAKWAISEFLKNLWHDIFNERIPPGKRVIVEYTFKGGIYYRSIEIPGDIQWVRGFSCEKRLRSSQRNYQETHRKRIVLE